MHHPKLPQRMPIKDGSSKTVGWIDLRKLAERLKARNPQAAQRIDSLFA